MTKTFEVGKVLRGFYLALEGPFFLAPVDEVVAW